MNKQVNAQLDVQVSPSCSIEKGNPTPMTSQTKPSSLIAEIVCPIDSFRYGSEEMRSLFTNHNRYRFFLQIEASLAQAQAEYGLIPREAAEAISSLTLAPDSLITRVAELESETKHELAAVTRAFAEQLHDYGRFVHYGATSSDILDTAMAMQIKAAIQILEKKIVGLSLLLSRLIREHADTIMVGRTHGRHALPITFGFKVAIWLDGLARNLERLRSLKSRVLVGKMSGAVGSMAGFAGKGDLIQRAVMARLGLYEPQITSQAVARDRVAEFVLWAGLFGAFLETIATEIRNLQRSEIGEVEEPFEDESQVGSSTMPHKRNPVLCENVCSLSRLIRSFSSVAFENINLWHERDLTNSGNERFTVPQCCILTDEILEKMIFVIGHMRINVEKMKDNMRISHNTMLAERALLFLVSRGVERSAAYAIVQAIAFKALREGADFLESLRKAEKTCGMDLPVFIDDIEYTGDCRALSEKVLDAWKAEPAMRELEGLHAL